MAAIRGETVYHLTPVSRVDDVLAVPIVEDYVRDKVDNVLICPVSSDSWADNTDLDDRRLTYELLIPKADAHSWTGVLVEFWGERWRTIGSPLAYSNELTPGEWNMRVKVQREE